MDENLIPEIEKNAAQDAAQDAAKKLKVPVAEQPDSFDIEYVRKLRAEAAEYRRKLRELENKTREDEEKKVSEQENLQKRLTEYERKEAELQQTLRTKTLEYEVKLCAVQLGIVDPEAAYRLLDIEQIEYDKDGNPSNIEKVVKELISKKPYLVNSMPSASPTNPTQRRTPTEDALMIALRKGAGLPIK